MNSIHKSWLPLFEKHNLINCGIETKSIQLPSEITNQINNNINIYPPKEKIFRIFEMNLNEIQIVLLGQDPYHRLGQAHGLSFSVSDKIKIPPSLKNIYKELQNNFPERNYTFNSGNLEKWFQNEKIFLLNASLTVIDGKPGTHIKLWKDFTDDVIKYIAENNKKCIFLLLGNFAKEKAQFIEDKSRILTCPHPSPLARGFIGSEIFKKVEEKLGKSIDWSIY
jgi:uracil-DNA glycosylase